MATDLILASTSKYRRALMERLGIPFRAVAPPFDERSVPVDRDPPAVLAGRLALGKAESVASLHPGAVVVGSDQLVAFDGQVLGKPGTAEGCRRQLGALFGATHELITALVVIGRGRTLRHTDVARLRMRRLSAGEIARYVDRDVPTDCAGSYKIEAGGVVLFDRVESDDQTAIVGLPLIALTGFLLELGFAIP